MGFSVSATMAIFFATFLIFFVLMYESLDGSFKTISDDLDDRYNDAFEKTQITFEMVEVNYDRENNVLNIQMKNAGSITLKTNETSVLLDGLLVSAGNVSKRIVGAGATDYWHPNEIMEVNVTSPDLAYVASITDRRVFSASVSLAEAGNVSVTDQAYIIDGTSIDVFDLDGVYRRTITDGINMMSPSDIKVQGNYAYVLDQYTHIDRFTTAGSWVDRIVNDTTNTSNPRAFAADSNYFYIIDNNDHVDRYTIAGAFVDALIPNGGTMSAPQDIYVSDRIYIIDYSAGSYHVDCYALDGTSGTQLIASAQLSSPRDIAVSDKDLSDRHIYIANNTREIAVFNSTGAPVENITSGLSTSVRGVDVTGRIFVTDEANGLVCEHLGTSIKLVFDRGSTKLIQL